MGMVQTPNEKVWDKHEIKAAIARKGLSLTALARSYGIPAQTVRNALEKPSKSGELVIAQFLEKPLHVLFPERWTIVNKRIYPRYSKKQM